MVEVALVKALSAFFAVDSILVCPEKNLDDHNVEIWNSMLKDIGINFHVYLGGGGLGPELFQEDIAMVYLTDEECFAEIVDDVGLMSNVVWLAPDFIHPPTEEHLRLDSFWISFSNNTGSETIELVEHYAVSHEKTFSQTLGTFSTASGLNIPEVDIWHRRNNLEGANLKNTVEDYPAVTDFVNDDHHELEGILPDIVFNLQAIMNFTVTNVRTPDGEWGVEKQFENGTKYWSGLVGELVAKRAHFSIGGLTINPERGSVIDFSVAVVPETLSIAIGTESVSTGNINTMAFIKCLAPTTWFVFLGFAALYGVCYILVEFAKDDKHYGYSSLKLYGFVVVGKVFLKLPIDIGTRFSQKLMYMTVFFLCLFVFEGYIANLTAEMTVGKPRVHLRSFQDIIDQEITIYVKKGTISDTFFAEAQEGTTKYIVNKYHLDRETFKMNDDAVAEITKNPKAAYYHTLIVFVKYGTKVTTLPNFDGRINAFVGIGLQKDSELRAVFDYHIMTMRQSGLLDDMYTKHLMKDQPEDNSDRIFQEDILVLGFDNLFLPANIMGIGMVLAIMFSICEKVTSGKRVQEKHGPMSGWSDEIHQIKN